MYAPSRPLGLSRANSKPTPRVYTCGEGSGELRSARALAVESWVLGVGLACLFRLTSDLGPLRLLT
jgi:hypothetical protein